MGRRRRKEKVKEKGEGKGGGGGVQSDRAVRQSLQMRARQDLHRSRTAGPSPYSTDADLPGFSSGATASGPAPTTASLCFVAAGLMISSVSYLTPPKQQNNKRTVSTRLALAPRPAAPSAGGPRRGPAKPDAVTKSLTLRSRTLAEPPAIAAATESATGPKAEQSDGFPRACPGFVCGVCAPCDRVDEARRAPSPERVVEASLRGPVADVTPVAEHTRAAPSRRRRGRIPSAQTDG